MLGAHDERPPKRPLLKTARRQFPQFCSELTLGELFTTTCLAKTDFLTFDFTSVTCNKTCLRQNRLESCIVIDQSAGNTVTDSAGLTGFTAAANIDFDVECFDVVGEDERPVSRWMYSSRERPLISILPVPRFMKTRATELLRRPVP